MENSQQKGCLFPFIASWNYIPRVICANDACRIHSREICRIRETVYLFERVLQKKLWAFNTRQRDHELIRQNAAYENRKLISGNSLVVIYFGVHYPSNICKVQETEWFTKSLPFAEWDVQYSLVRLYQQTNMSLL